VARGAPGEWNFEYLPNLGIVSVETAGDLDCDATVAAVLTPWTAREEAIRAYESFMRSNGPPHRLRGDSEAALAWLPNHRSAQSS
jgi:hypothetical protein